MLLESNPYFLGSSSCAFFLPLFGEKGVETNLNFKQQTKKRRGRRESQERSCEQPKRGKRRKIDIKFIILSFFVFLPDVSKKMKKFFLL